MKYNLILALLSLFILSCNNNRLKDIDGNEYQTVKIGEQVWMAENLKVSKFRNGESIPIIHNSNEWNKTFFPAISLYDNNEENKQKYGYLYNWYAVNDIRKIAPKGWRIPTENDINILIMHLQGDTTAAYKLKETGNKHWLFTNEANNETGFTALPNGYRNGIDGGFYALNSNAYWWTEKNSFEMFAWTKRIYKTFADIERDSTFKTYGFAIRCIKE